MDYLKELEEWIIAFDIDSWCRPGDPELLTVKAQKRLKTLMLFYMMH